LWEGRFKASLIDSETYLLEVMRYIELNPVRAFMVESPEEYQWSSFKHNTGQLAMASIIEHSAFVGLGRTLAESRIFYLKGFNQVLSQKAVKKITAAWLTGTPLGNERFELKIEETLSKRVGLARKGRPRKIN
jgi:putative transposase